MELRVTSYEVLLGTEKKPLVQIININTMNFFYAKI